MTFPLLCQLYLFAEQLSVLCAAHCIAHNAALFGRFSTQALCSIHTIHTTHYTQTIVDIILQQPQTVPFYTTCILGSDFKKMFKSLSLYLSDTCTLLPVLVWPSNKHLNVLVIKWRISYKVFSVKCTLHISYTKALQVNG